MSIRASHYRLRPSFLKLLFGRTQRRERPALEGGFGKFSLLCKALGRPLRCRERAVR
jgi:hypothetical protein